MYKIAIDLMGGDKAPKAVLEGIELFTKNTNYKTTFLLFGLKDTLATVPTSIKSHCELIECETKVDATTKPSYAIKNMRNSSMAMAIKAVKEGRADAALSAGNTGALMAFSKILVNQIQDIDKPPLCTILPTQQNKTVMLDLGAVIDCKPHNLMEFAIMGSAFISAAYPEIHKPTIGILNVGSENGKGNALIKETCELISASSLKDNFYGFIEGDDIPFGKVNVVVTDGFSGNVALKTYEGAGRLIKSYLQEAFSKNIIAKIGYLLAKKSLQNVFYKMNSNNYNGALLLGLENIVVKSHGSATAEGFANAIKVTYNLIENDINNKIRQLIKK